MRLDKEKAVKMLYSLGNWVVRIVGSIIFLGLAWYSFRYTQYMMPYGGELPVEVLDSRTRNILGLGLAVGIMALLVFLERRTDRRHQLLARRVTLAVALAWVAAAGGWWIFSSGHVPSGDQAFIYGGASNFMKGNYSFLETTGYCGMHPHQLGLIALCELLFRVTGPYNYRAFEIVCLVLAVGSVYLGYRILSEITKSTAAIIGYNILMLGCLPLILYTPWVYGEIPSIFFALLAEWMLLRYASEGKTRYLAILAGSLVMAMLVRKNSMILLVAVCLAAVLHALLHKDRRILLAFLAAVVCSYGSYGAINKMYEIRSGYEHDKGIPIIAWVTMGMQEGYGIYGWFNNYPKEIYFEAEYDKARTAQMAKQDLVERLEAFRDDPGYALSFFKQKILSQWNEPLYQAMYFNAESTERSGGPEPGSLAARLGDDYFVKVLAVCDRWQFVVYVGMLCYFLLAVRKDSDILQHMLAVTMIGGFFFSILYEAKARYIFPYYVMMFPYAAHGYQQAVWRLAFMLKRRLGSRKVVDIEEGRRAA